MNRWPWLLVIFGCLALLVSLGEWRRMGVTSVGQRVTAGEPDLLMEQATITQFGEDGTVRYRLLSTEVRHYEDQQITHLVAPTLTLNRTAPQPPWSARANEGFVHDTQGEHGETAELIVLRDDVHLTQHEPDPIEITGPSMNIFPERQFAETDQPVMIQTAAGRSYAAGMSGDLNTGLFKLKSIESQRVHTVVLPEQFRRATNKPSS